MIKLVLFDLDNTLYPTSEQVNACRKASIKSMIRAGLKGRQTILLKRLYEIIRELGSNSEEHYNKLVDEVYGQGPDYYRLVSAGITAYNVTKQATMKLYDDAISTLKSIKTSIGILTKGNALKQWDKIYRLGLNDLFKKVWIVKDNESKEGKISEILTSLKLKPKEVIMVGDRMDSDIKPANNKGLITVRLMKGPYKSQQGKADYKIKALKEVIGILKEN
ncbi:MAG: HAD hydrolase-like protein [Candidatus Nanoarchaeia archaeon]|jgi:putative hydrolase of the HAD superfamily